MFIIHVRKVDNVFYLFPAYNSAVHKRIVVDVVK